MFLSLDLVISECSGQLRASNELRKQGIFVSPSGVRSIWLRYDLASLKQRLKALEKKQDDDVVCGSIETAHTGCRLSR